MLQLPLPLHFDPVVPHRALYFLVVVELSDFCNVESLIVAQVLGNVQLVEVGVLLLALKGELLPVAMGVFREVDSEVLQVELEVGVELVHFAH